MTGASGLVQSSHMDKQRLVVGISGSSGAILGIRLLAALRGSPIETHLVVTPSARLTIQQETRWTVPEVLALAAASYDPDDLAAPIASGSFAAMGMVVIPCSVKSLSSIANSYSSDLLTRAADVTLKEGRRLVLVVRETPLHIGHIRLMELAAQSGAVIFPPVPAFYAHPQSVDEIVDNLVGRVLSRMGVENDLYRPWQGLQPPHPAGDAQPDPAAVWDLPALTLATLGQDGMPHTAVLSFVADEDYQSLFFFIEDASQIHQDLLAAPRAAVAIAPNAPGQRSEPGLQMRGSVQRIEPGDPWERAWARYLVKFPFTSNFKTETVRRILYQFRPDWTCWHKEEQDS